MPESNSTVNAFIDVVFTDRTIQVVPLTALPFLIGRGEENGNHLSINDMRISRTCAGIFQGESGLILEDCGQRGGIFVNGEPVKAHPLAHGDHIRLGADEACQLLFRLPPEAVAQEQAENKLRSILGSMGSGSSEELNSLKLLLEATSLMHSQLPLESVLSTMLDHAIVITRADRGMLLEPDPSGVLHVKLARGRDGQTLEPEAHEPQPIRPRQRHRARLSRHQRGPEPIRAEPPERPKCRPPAPPLVGRYSPLLHPVPQALDIPLRTPICSALSTSTPAEPPPSQPSTARSSTPSVHRQEASSRTPASSSANANASASSRNSVSHVRSSRDSSRKGSRTSPHFSVSGTHQPCNEVGGDYFDVFPMSDGRLALLIADVAGKGLGAALVTTMLQGALSGMTLGVDPVKVFNHLNQFLCDRASVARCATMFFGLLSPNGNLEYVRAGHPSPLLLRNGTVTELYNTGSLPIGLFENEAYESTRIQLRLGDTLLLIHGRRDRS